MLALLLLFGRTTVTVSQRSVKYTADDEAQNTFFEQLSDRNERNIKKKESKELFYLFLCYNLVKNNKVS